MKDVVKKLLKDGIGAVGDRMNEHVCPLVLYQPKACKRGEILHEIQGHQPVDTERTGN